MANLFFCLIYNNPYSNGNFFGRLISLIGADAKTWIVVSPTEGQHQNYVV